MSNIKNKLLTQVGLNAGILILSVVAIAIAEIIKILFKAQPFSFEVLIRECSNADLVFAIFTAECTNICWRFIDQDIIGFSGKYLFFTIAYCLIVGVIYVIALAVEKGVPGLVQWVFFLAAVCYIVDVAIIYRRLKKHESKVPTNQSVGYLDNEWRYAGC